MACDPISFWDPPSPWRGDPVATGNIITMEILLQREIQLLLSTMEIPLQREHLLATTGIPLQRESPSYKAALACGSHFNFMFVISISLFDEQENTNLEQGKTNIERAWFVFLCLWFVCFFLFAEQGKRTSSARGSRFLMFVVRLLMLFEQASRFAFS